MPSRRTRRRSDTNVPLIVVVLLGFGLLVGSAAWLLSDAQSESPGAVEELLVEDDEPAPADLSLPASLEEQQAERLDTVVRNPVGSARSDVIEVPAGTPRASIAGLVRDEAGEPIQGAQLSIYQGNPLLAGPFPGARKVVKTTALSLADGSFELRGVPVGKDYVVVAEHDDYARTERPNLRLNPDTPITGLVLRMPDGAEVTGVVSDAGGMPLSGARVEFFDNIVNAQLKLADQKPWKIALTDDAGNYVFEHVSSTAYRLRASMPGFEAQSRAISSAFEVKAKNQTVSFALNPGSDLPGRVVDENGEPVRDVYLVANSLTKDYTGTASATSREDGTFLLEGLGEHDYQLRAVAEGYTRLQRRINVTDGDVFIELQSQLGAHLHVTDGGGSPVTSFTASLMRAHAGRDPSLTNDQRAVRDADGHVLFDGLDPGSYALRVDAAGFASADTEIFELVRGQELPEVRVSLVGGGTLTGRVLDTQGEPVAGVLVRVHPNGYQDRFIDGLFGPPPAERKIQMRTDEDGAFKLVNIAPGTYQIRAVHLAAPPAIRNDVTIFDDDVRENTPIELRLPAAGSLAGQAIDNSGRAMPAVTIQVVRGAEFNELLTTDAEGRFRVDNLLEGEYSLSLRPERDDAGKPLNPLIAMVYAKKSLTDVFVRSGQHVDGVLLVAPPMDPTNP